MNILILSPYLPYPLSSGGAQGMFNMIDRLRFKHRYTLVVSEGSTNRRSNKAALQKLWPEVDIIYYPFWRQLMCRSFFFEKTRRVLLKKFAPGSRKLAVEKAVRPYGEWFSSHHVAFINNIIEQKKIDLVQVEFYECLPWARYLTPHIRKVFIHHELGFVRKERLLSGLTLTDKEQEQFAAAKRRELEDLERYDAVMTVTAIDKDVLLREGLKTPLYVSTLAINTPSFPYIVKPRLLSFVGGYGHQPNKEGMDWFVSEVAPLLADQQLTLNLIGNSWPQSYKNCQDVNIVLKGYVENLHEVALGTIMIVPILSGSGMRMKILEAAAMSLPVVTTTVGVEGLEFVNGVSCLIADTPEEFADAIKLLGNDAPLREALGYKANRLFNDKYHPDVLAMKREEIYQAISDSDK